jgi:predicted esterase
MSPIVVGMSLVSYCRDRMSTSHREHSIVTPVHGRYLIRVPESGHGPQRNAPMAVGFHGYGETADTQMARMEAVPELAEWTLVSIQGLHAFYSRDGRTVVASWMTSQQREEAIDDNLRYVRSVVTEAIHQNGEPRALVYIGYSQGVAMAWRAAVLGARRTDGLAVFGGDVPPELGVRPLTQCPPVLIGRGREDAIYTAAHFRADLDMLASRFVVVEPYEVEGGHAWSPRAGREVGAFVQRLVNPPAVANM